MRGPAPADDVPDPADEVGLDDLLDDLADPDSDTPDPADTTADVEADTPDPADDVAGRSELHTFDNICDDVCDPRPEHRPQRLSKGGFIERFCRQYFGPRGPE
jgi:hypothetical protein